MTAVWLAPALAVVVAIVVSLVGVQVLLQRGLVRLEALRAAHWTERARIFAETQARAIWFRRCLVMGTALLVLPETAPANAPRFALRFFLAATIAGALSSYVPISRWVSRATAGQLTPSGLWRSLGYGAVFSPSFWIVVAFAVSAPTRYDHAGERWALGLVVTLVAAAAGGGVLVGRVLGLIRPVAGDVQAVIAAAAHARGMKSPRVFEVPSSYIGAFAVPYFAWVVVTSATLTRLAPRYVPALVTEAARRARHSPTATLTRVAPAAASACFIGFVPLFPESRAVGLVFGYGVWFLLERVFKWTHAAAPHLTVKRGSQATSDEQKQHRRAEWRAYAMSLVAQARQYQANWTPIVSDAAPSLYDLLKGASVRLPYPRPRVARGFDLLVGAIGVALALLIGGPGMDLFARVVVAK